MAPIGDYTLLHSFCRASPNGFFVSPYLENQKKVPIGIFGEIPPLSDPLRWLLFWKSRKDALIFFGTSVLRGSANIAFGYRGQPILPTPRSTQIISGD